MAHRLRHRWVDRADSLVHRLRHGAVGGVTLAAGAKLDQVHRFAGVEVEHVADAVAEAERIGGGVALPGLLEPLELEAGQLEPTLVLVADPRFANLLGY